MKKISLVLLFAVLFGLILTTSVFAGPPPNGRYGSSDRGWMVMVHFMPASQHWEVVMWWNGNMVFNEITTDTSTLPNGAYIIRFNFRGQVWRIEHGGAYAPGVVGLVRGSSLEGMLRRNTN